MFQTMHILILAAAGCGVMATCSVVKTKEKNAVERWLKICAVAVLLFDPVYWMWEMRHFGRIAAATTLPLYLCSLFGYLLPVALFAKQEGLRQMASATVCTIGMLGGVFGLVFNIYLNHYPFFSFVPLRSLLYHVIMVLVSAAMWASGYYTPQRKDRYLCFVPVLVLLGISLLLNRLYGWDYCYTAGGIGTPLERLSAVLPKGLFLLTLYGGLLLLIQVVFYRRFLSFPFSRPKAENS